MKKLVLFHFAVTFKILSLAQNATTQFIDSLANKSNQKKLLVLFTEYRDTNDGKAGARFTRRNSYYFDWGHKELRYIEVYEFDKIVKERAIEKTLRKNKTTIPSRTQTIYTFFQNKLVKVKLIPSSRQCEQCFGEYYFVDDNIIYKNEKNILGQNRDFIDDANFFLARLYITKGSDNLLSHKQ